MRRYRFDGDFSPHRSRAEKLASTLKIFRNVSTQVWEPCGRVALDIRYHEKREDDDIVGLVGMENGRADYE